MPREDEIRARLERAEGWDVFATFRESPQLLRDADYLLNQNAYKDRVIADMHEQIAGWREENQRLREFVKAVYNVIQPDCELSNDTWQAYRPLYKPLEKVIQLEGFGNEEALQPKDGEQE